MDVVLASVSEHFVLQHDVLPGDGLIEIELDLVDLVLGLHVDKEVGVVENGID